MTLRAVSPFDNWPGLLYSFTKHLSGGRGILGKKRKDIQTKDLCRLLVYILGHRPDEFGLIPDSRGFVPYKELLKALHEEAGWGFVRSSHINEVLVSEQRGLFEADEKQIRAKDRVWDPDLNTPAQVLPKILFTPVRRKAHPVVMEKGLKASPQGHVVLTPSKAMALRIGRRRDPEPVLLEIRAHSAQQAGTAFSSFGDLFMGPEIPAAFIAGPQPPKAQPETQKGEDKKKRDQAQKVPGSPTPGTFVLDPQRDPDPRRRDKRGKGKKPRGWKEAARKQRRRK